MPNKKLLAVTTVVAVLVLSVFVFWGSVTRTVAYLEETFFEPEPDMPEILRGSKARFLDKQEFLIGRSRQFNQLRGINETGVIDPKLRRDAVATMDDQIQKVEEMPDSATKSLLTNSWSSIGPNPIFAGGNRYSGRVISIAVHPTNPDIVYVGAAQGGLYRTTNGGLNWTQLFNSAESLAIGAIAISPSDPETVYVGTGEHNFSLDSFFGVGVYRISNASTTATLTGPLNQDATNFDVFTGRGISRIIVHPTDSSIIFVSTTSGLGGISGTSFRFPSRGIYRSTNADSANPTFAKLTGLAGNINASVRDIAVDPRDPNLMIASLIAGSGTGGIYRTTNALAASPTFTQTFPINASSTGELNVEFAAFDTGAGNDPIFYGATGNLGGRLLRSTDGGQTWTQRIDNNFCTPQCFYDIAVAVDPTDSDNVFLGGSPQLVAGRSVDGGATFFDTGNSSNVHVDTHALAVAPSDPTVVYVGTDGGIYKSTNSGQTWDHLNTPEFLATQFMSIAVHPTDPDFTIGGTQDNGTNMYQTAGGIWQRIIGGDGGYTQIDQNPSQSPDTNTVRLYHTFFNRVNSLLGYQTRASNTSAFQFRGCGNNIPGNGINCNDSAVLFYAPLERGPGNPNTIYYGTDRVYRSDDTGATHTVVSQAPIQSGVAVSAIGIAPTDDNVRIVGLRNGELRGTTTGSATLTDLDPSNVIPNAFIARAVIDPTNANTAYVTISSFGVDNVFKTTNLNASPPTWTPANGTGANAIPQVPVSAFAINPDDTNKIYAGTDIGVYASEDGGANWAPLGTGLPRVAVFGMAVTAAPRKLRIATHGQGMFEIPLAAAGGSTRFDFTGDGRADISVFRRNQGQWWFLNSDTNQDGAFAFGTSTDVPAPADFTGDGIADFTFWRPSSGEWFVLRSDNTGFFSFPFGATGDIPAPGDFDGDGTDDAAVYRPSSGTWFVLRSSDGQTEFVPFGAAVDEPLVADYDGDGTDDVAVYKPDVAQFWQIRSSEGLRAFAFGTTTDVAMTADFSGDGTSDMVLFRPTSGEWFVLRSEDSNFFGFPFGANGDIPAPADYDGDGTADPTVFRPTSTTWFSQQSTNGAVFTPFGLSTDEPLPATFNAND